MPTRQRFQSVDAYSHPYLPPVPLTDAGKLSQEIAGEVRDMAIALFDGSLSAPLYQKAVATLESAKVQRFGFRLHAERLDCGSSRLHLTDAESGRSHATFHFVSTREDLRRRRYHG